MGSHYFSGPHPWIDVRAKGAMGDGISDDTIAIQDAINALSVSGGTIFIPSGVYNVSYLLMANNVTLCGEGNASVLSATDTPPGHGVIDVYSKSGWSIRDLKIDGNSESGTLLSSTCGIILLKTTTDVTDFRISNVYLHDCCLRALNIRSGIDGTVENLTIENGCTETALLIGTDHGEDFDVKRLAFNNIIIKQVLSDGIGVYTYDTTDKVFDILFDNIQVTEPSGHGIFLSGGVKDCSICNFILTDGQGVNGNGLYFEGGARHTISNGIIKNYQLYGIGIGGGAPSDINISNVNIHQCQRGVVIEPNTSPTASKISFDNINTIECDYDGWYIAGSYHTFSNCSSQNDGQGVGTYAGFYLQANVAGATPSNLSFVNCKSFGNDYGINFGDFCSKISVDEGTRFTGLTRNVYFSSANAKSAITWGNSMHNVAFFGATGNGITNDTAAILEAYDAIPSSGGTLFFPPGVYLCTPSQLVIDKSNVVILGRGACLRAYGSLWTSAIMIQVHGVTGDFVSDIKVIGLEIDGMQGSNPPPDAPSQAHLIDINRTSRMWIEDCYLHDSHGDGVNIAYHLYNDTPSDIFILNNRIDTCLRNGISVASGERVCIDNNIITNFNTVGIDIEPDSDECTTKFIKITNNHVSPASTQINVYNSNRLYGISANAAGGITDNCSEILIAHNSVTGITDSGIQYPNSGIFIKLIRGIEVSNNHIYQCRNGITSASELSVNGSTGVFSNNHIKECKGIGSIGIGVFSHINVNNNIIELCDDMGIFVYRGNNLCIGNICRNNGQNTTPSYPYGIYTEAGPNRMVNNICYDDQVSKTQTYGIYLANGTTDVVLENNDVSNNATAGIRWVTGNTIRNNKGFITENSGTSSILNGTTSIVVVHGLGVVPRAQDVQITFLENPTNNPGLLWIDTIDATNFTVNVENDPGASGLDFAWKITARE